MKKLALLTLTLLLTFGTVAHATTPARTTDAEQRALDGCVLLAKLSYEAMYNYQHGFNPQQNTARLNQRLGHELSDNFGQQTVPALINLTIETVYTQPKGVTTQEKDQMATLLAFGALRGCADEAGLDLTKLQ